MINSQPSIDEGLTVIVAGGELFGPDVPDAILDGCAKLADSTKTKLLEVKLSRIDGNLIFNNASPFPNLQLGGEKIIKKLKQILKEGVD